MTDARETRFNEIYAQHERAVLAYFLRRTDPTSARDGAAETFLVAWRRIDDVPPADRTLPWLFGVARKVLANQRRSRDRFLALRRKLTGFAASPTQSPENQVIQDVESEEMLSAIARLRETDRELLRLVSWEELSHAQAAAVLGTSTHAVAQRLYRVTKRLRRDLRTGRDVALADRSGEERTRGGGS
jgi:RNA polymerase sigma-70 factor (ECF subfamily)